jgi:hypothetical protein
MDPQIERFSPATRTVLEKAGWFPGRDIAKQLEQWKRKLEKSGFPMSAAAEKVLREFGGLNIRQEGPGLEMARQSFELDPSVAEHEKECFAAHSRFAGTSLSPLGEHEDGHGYLAIGDDGRVFLMGLVSDDLWLEGNTIEEALEALIQGKRTPLIATNVEGSGPSVGFTQRRKEF